MFRKVLIAEDHEVSNLGIIETLTELHISSYEFFTYCDDALLALKSAIKKSKPFDLLITDLSFEADHRKQKVTSGRQLIEEVRKLQPNLKIIVFSVEKKPKWVDQLFKDYDINGFVSKGRNDGRELKNAIRKVYDNEIFIPSEILAAIRSNAVEVSAYDVILLELLAQGYKQHEIENHLRSKNIKPDSRSSIEKRLNDLRETVGAKNNIEMVVICKDLGII